MNVNMNQLVENQKGESMRDILTKAIFPRIIGNDKLKLALTLQVFGAETRLLIVGQQSSGKSAMLRAIKPYLEIYVGHNLDIWNGHGLSREVLSRDSLYLIDEIDKIPDETMRYLISKAMCGHPIIATTTETSSFRPLLVGLSDCIAVAEKIENSNLEMEDTSISEVDDRFLKQYIENANKIQPVIREGKEVDILKCPMYIRKMAVAYARMESRKEITLDSIQLIRQMIRR